MTITSAVYDAVLQQMAAESYMEGVDLANNNAVALALQRGNTRQGFDVRKGFTKFTDVQAAEFLTKYQIVAQASDYAGSGVTARSTTVPVYYSGTSILANSGMSVTLIQQKGTSNFTLAIRSTENRGESHGGDRIRDTYGADVSGIGLTGFALAQLSALEDYFSYLKQSGKLPSGSVLNVSGYSLGGHLATVFTEMHASDSDVALANAYTFNGAGRGTWTRNAINPAEIVAYYKSVLADPTVAAGYAATLGGVERSHYDAARGAQISGVPYNAVNLYEDPRHTWAQNATGAQFGLGVFNPSDLGSTDLRNGAASRIIQIYGREFPGESTAVANSGVHGPATGVFVEAQPLTEGNALPGGAADWGNAHQLILIADSLAVMRAYQSLDPSVSLETLNTLFSAFSNKRAQVAIIGSDSTSSATTEDDPLESALDALRRLLVGPNVARTVYRPGPTGFGNLDFRNGFYSNLQELDSAIADHKGVSGTQYTFQNLTGFSPTFVASTAQVNDDLGKAYRYALKNLNPFALFVTGTQPTVYIDGRYAKFDRDTAQGGLTDQYLTDRATMLNWLVARNTVNADDVLPSSLVSGPTRYTDLVTRTDGKTTSFRVIAAGDTTALNTSPDSPALKRFVFGTDTSDAVQGGQAVDRLYGGAGTDIMIGGVGNDYLEGGTGVDIYSYSATQGFLGVGSSYDGDDEIRDADGKGLLRYTYSPTSGGAQTKVIGRAAIKQSATRWQSADGKFTYDKVGNDLKVTINGDQGGTLTLRDFRDGDFGFSLLDAPSAPTEQVRTFFGDRQDWDSDPVADGVQAEADGLGNIKRADGQGGRPDLVQADRADNFYGSAAEEVEYFLTAGGNDQVLGDGVNSNLSTGGGRDFIDAGTGQDGVSAGGGNDWVEGGAGADVLLGNAGDDVLYADTSDNQTFTLAQAIEAGETAATVAGPELLSGDDGNDFLFGANASDLILGGIGEDLIVGGGGDDTVYADDSLFYAFQNWALVRTVPASGGAQRDSVSFSNAAMTSDLAAGGKDVIYSGAGNDWVFAGAGDDYVESGKGMDVVHGEGGNDVLVAGDDNDFLYGDSALTDSAGLSGDDYLDGGAGDDQLFGGKGDDVLIGGAGIDTLFGDEGSDILWGGAGDDYIVRSAGKDTYVYNRGDGKDTFLQFPGGVDPAAGLNLALGDGIKPEDVKFRVGSLMVDFGNGDAIHLEGFDPDDPNSTQVLDGIQFADGTSMSYQDVLDQGFDLDGTEDDDLIVGTAVTDRIDGKGGDDTLAGNGGDDVLTGGTGNDVLQGGAGTDAYVLNRGDGQDLVDDAIAITLSSNNSDQASVLSLGAGIARSEVKFRLDQENNHLLVDAGLGDTVSFAHFNPDAPEFTPELGTIAFADGSSMSYAELLAQGFDLQGSEEEDIIRGTAVTDRVQALEGVDYVASGAGEDVLEGGAGDDVLDAGADDDLLDGGEGNDALYGGEGNDTLIGGEGANSLQGDAGDDALFAGDGDTVIDTQGHNHLDLTAYGALDTSNAEITQFQADGGDIYLNVHVRDAQNPGATPDTGGVSVQGELAHFGTITLNDGSGGTVTLTSSEFSQYVAGGLILGGTAAADTIFGTAAGDTIKGLAGADTIDAGAGADRIDGGSGNDTLAGGPGNDTYLLGFNGGRDTVIEDGEPGSTNTIQLGDGVGFELLRSARLGEDLRIEVKGTGEGVLIKDFYLQPQAWQEGWSVLDGEGNTFALAAVPAEAIPPAAEWLSSLQEDYLLRREQVFAAQMAADGFALAGDNVFRRVDRGFSFEAGQTTSTTNVTGLQVSAAGDPDRALVTLDQSSYGTSFVQRVGRTVIGSTGAGRSAPQSGSSGLPNPYFVAAGGAAGLQIPAGATVVPVYGPVIGVPPRNAQGLIDPNAMRLTGFWVYSGEPPTSSSPALVQRLVQNVVETIAVDTRVERTVTVPDADLSASDAPQEIQAQSSLVRTGAGGDDINLDADAFLSGFEFNVAQAYLRLHDWRSDLDLGSSNDARSPWHAESRYLLAHTPADQLNAGTFYNNPVADQQGYLGGFVAAGAGDDSVTGGSGQDAIAGGDGDDEIDGLGGADTYLYSASESGVDALHDGGSGVLAYLDWYYGNQGIGNWDERMMYGGLYRSDMVFGGRALEGVPEYFDTKQEASHDQSQDRKATYIPALAAGAPILRRTDTAQLESLMDAGVLPRDVVRFGPGLSLADLDLTVSPYDPDDIEDHPETPLYGGGLLSVRWGDAGFDLEVPDVDFGFDFAEGQAALPTTAFRVTNINFYDGFPSVDSGFGFDSLENYRLGAGVDNFLFADGTMYSLEEILQQAKIALVGTEGEDALFGGPQDELIRGLGESDTIDGGQGDDRLEGGSGHDRYFFARGYGHDTVFDESGFDSVQLDLGIAPTDIVLSRYGDNYTLTIQGSGDSLTLQRQFDEDNVIETVFFDDDDGTEWDAAYLYDHFAALNRAPAAASPIAGQRASDGSNFQFSIPAGTFIDPDAGDTLGYEAALADGGELPAWLSFGAGTGTFSGTPGGSDVGSVFTVRVTAKDGGGLAAFADFDLTVVPPSLVLTTSPLGGSLDGGAGDDILTGLQGNDYLYGNDGYDTLAGGAGDDFLDGGEGNDSLDGGPGYEDLLGGLGDDTYRYDTGDGYDYIYDEGGSDSIEFGAGIHAGDVTVQKDSYGGLVLGVGAPGNYIYVEGWFDEESRIETVSFADGTAWDAAELESRITTASATPFDDVILGGDGNDIVAGGEGNDRVMGNEGNNLLLGGGEDDYLYADAAGARNLLIGGAGADGAVIFEGGSVLAFNAGDGEDAIYKVGDAPTLLSLGGVAAADLSFSTDGTTVRLGVSASDGISTFSYSPDPLRLPFGTLQIVGADIRTYDFAAVMQDFLDARAQNPGLTQWSAAQSLQNHLLSVSTTEAYGGAAAYQYATTGAVSGLTTAQMQAILADTNFVLAPQPIAPPNHAPTGMELSASTVPENAPGAAVGTLSTMDADAGDTFTYSILEGGDGAQFAIAGDELRVGAAGLDYEAGATRMVNVRTTDAAGAHFDRGFTIGVTDVQEGNTAPVVSAADTTVILGQSVAASSLFSVTDAESNPVTQYEFWDSTSGSGHFAVNGVEQGVDVSISVPASSLQDTFFVSGSVIGNDLVWVRANDGQAWSEWKSWTVTSSPHATNALPVVAAANGELLMGTSALAASLFSVSDADGDAIVQYEFWDDVAGGGHFSLSGVAQDNNPVPVSAAQLADFSYVAGSAPGTEQVWVRASDGIGWGAWKAWNMTSALHIPNAAPEIAAPAAQTVLLNGSVPASSLFAATDADQDAISQYEFWDSTAGGGHFAIGGVEQAVNAAIPVSAGALSAVSFEASDSIGSDLVWVRASDGQAWGAWTSWTMNSWPHAGNSAPAASAADAAILTGQAVAASSLFSVSDADGDSISRYQFWDDVSGGGYWRISGVQQAAGQNIDLTAADLANTQYVAGAGGGTERVWVRANDGLEWGAWQAWNMTSALHIPNAAPVISAPDATVLLGASVAASGLFAVADADSDPIAQYEFWDSTAGAGHFAVAGVEQAVNAAIPVSGSGLSAVTFEASESIGSDLVWVRASDGQTWSDWKSWTMGSAPHLTNAAPVASASTQGLLRNEAVAAASLFSVADADGDAVTQYQFWDDVNGGGQFELNGLPQAAGQNIDVAAAGLAGLTYVGGANAGTEQVWVRASDGMAWGAWKNWLMATEGGMLRGGAGPDTLNGDPETPVLEGGAGGDTLNAGDPNSLLSGGGGADALNGGAGNDLLAGGAGDDTIATGGGSNVIVHNLGDGADTLIADAGSVNTLSLGGGIGYGDLSLARDGGDLVLDTGNGDSLRLKDWYNGKDTVEHLQLILDATGAYDANSSDPLANRRVQSFDFRGMVSQFDQALAASPGLTSWALTNALLQYHLSGVDDAAIGGDLAYWYGRNNGFTGISLAAAQAAIGAAGFGSEAHSLHAFSGLQEGLVKLS